MAVNVETLGTLERRVSMSLPARDIEQQVDERLKQLARNVQDARLPARQGADEARGADLRPAGALRSAERRGAEVVQRGGEGGEAAASPAIRDREEGRRRRRGARVQRHLRGLSRSQARRPRRRRRRAAAGRRSTTPRSTRRIEILRKQRTTFVAVDARGEGRRPRDGRLRRHDRRRSPSRAARREDFAFVLGEGRMLPEFETAARGMEAGRAQDLRR